MAGRQWSEQPCLALSVVVILSMLPSSGCFYAAAPSLHSSHLLSAQASQTSLPRGPSHLCAHPPPLRRARLSSSVRATLDAPATGQGTSSLPADTTPLRRDKDIKIRRAHPDEIAALSKVITEVFAPGEGQVKSAWVLFQAYAGMIERLLKASIQQGMIESEDPTAKTGPSIGLTVLFVAEAEDTGEMVGVVELCSATCPMPPKTREEQQRAGEAERETAYLCNLAVREAFRGAGIGKSLIGACEDYAKERGCTDLFLDTDCDNKGAIRLYQASGYVCEMTDPPIRTKRRCFLRKRFSEDAPAYGEEVLGVTEEGDYLLPSEGPGVGELSFLERNFGTLAPAVAVLGGVIGVILF